MDDPNGTPSWDEESRADIEWREYLEDREVEIRDRMMERGEPVPIVKCLVCGYHYRAATIGPDGACIDHHRCSRNQRTQAMYRAVKDSRKRAA